MKGHCQELNAMRLQRDNGFDTKAEVIKMIQIVAMAMRWHFYIICVQRARYRVPHCPCYQPGISFAEHQGNEEDPIKAGVFGVGGLSCEGSGWAQSVHREQDDTTIE